MSETCDIRPHQGATPGLKPEVSAPGAPVCPRTEEAVAEKPAAQDATAFSGEARPKAPKAQARHNSLLTREVPKSSQPKVRMSVQARQLAESREHVERAERLLDAGQPKRAQGELRQAMVLYRDLKKTQADLPEVKQLGARIRAGGARWQGMRAKRVSHREASLRDWHSVYRLTAGSKDPQQQALHAEARKVLRGNLLAGLEKRLPQVIAKLEQQRSGGEASTSTHFRNEELLTALRYVVNNGAVVDGKRVYPVTIEEAIGLLPVAHKNAHEDFWKSPHIKEGWSVTLPEEGGALVDGDKRNREAAAAGAVFTQVAVKGDVTEAKARSVGIKTIHINGGTAELPSGHKAAVGYRFVVGEKGGQIQLSNRLYTFPPADHDRVVYVQRKGDRNEMIIKPNVKHSEDRFDGSGRAQKMGVTSGDANKQRLDALERAAKRLERLETADPDFYRHIQEFETQEGLEKMATPEAKREHLLEQAKADRHRSGSYELAADKLKQILAPHIDKALAGMSESEIQAIVAAERGEDSDIPLEQRIGERLLNYAFEKIDTGARYGRLDGYDKTAAQAWRVFDDMQDPLDKTGEVSDATLDQWTDMALLLGSAVLGGAGVKNVMAAFPKAIPALAQRGAIGLSRLGGRLGGARGAELAYDLGQWAVPRLATGVVATGVMTPTMATTQELMNPGQIGWGETSTMGLTIFAQQLGANIILPGVGGLTLGRIEAVSQAAASPAGVIGTNLLSGGIVDAATAKTLGGNVEEEVLIGLIMTGAMAPWMGISHSAVDVTRSQEIPIPLSRRVTDEAFPLVRPAEEAAFPLVTRSRSPMEEKTAPRTPKARQHDAMEEVTAARTPEARKSAVTDEATAARTPEAMKGDPSEEPTVAGKIDVLNLRPVAGATAAVPKDLNWFAIQADAVGYLSNMHQFFADFMPRIGRDSPWHAMASEHRRALEPLYDAHQQIKGVRRLEGQIDKAAQAQLTKHPEFMATERGRIRELEARDAELNKRAVVTEESTNLRLDAIEEELQSLDAQPRNGENSQRRIELLDERERINDARDAIADERDQLLSEISRLNSQVDRAAREAVQDEMAPVIEERRVHRDAIREKLNRETQQEIHALDVAEAKLEHELSLGGSILLHERIKEIQRFRVTLRRGMEAKTFDATEQLYWLTASRRERASFYQADQALGRAMDAARLHYRPIQIRLVSLDTNSHGAVRGGIVELPHAEMDTFLDLENPGNSFTRRPDGSPLRPQDVAYVNMAIRNRKTGHVDQVRVTSETELDEALVSRGWTTDGRPAAIPNATSLGHRLAPMIRAELRAAGLAPNEPGLNVHVNEVQSISGETVLHIGVVIDSRIGKLAEVEAALRDTGSRMSQKLGRPVQLEVSSIQSAKRGGVTGELVPLAVND